METELILCDCGWSAHQIILCFFTEEDDEEPWIYVHFHLNYTRGFFKRLWYGLRYVLGYHCRFGHWDEVLMNEKTILELQEFLKRFLNLRRGAQDGKEADG